MLSKFGCTTIFGMTRTTSATNSGGGLSARPEIADPVSRDNVDVENWPLEEFCIRRLMASRDSRVPAMLQSNHRGELQQTS